MNPLSYYFKFSGRVSLKQYVLSLILPLLFLNTLGYLIDVHLIGRPEDLWARGPILLLIAVPVASVLVRRCHDRNLSGWIALLMLIPIANIWLAIELVRVGNQGDNRFGCDPRQTPPGGTTTDQRRMVCGE